MGELGPAPGGLCLSQPCPNPGGQTLAGAGAGARALGSLGNADSSGMGVNPWWILLCLSPITSHLICSEPVWGEGATICHPLGGFGIPGQELYGLGILVEELGVSLCTTGDSQGLQCCSLDFWVPRPGKGSWSGWLQVSPLRDRAIPRDLDKLEQRPVGIS